MKYYNNENWIDAIINLEIEQRLSGVIVYGCPYLYQRIREAIKENIPLAYSPSQTEAAQNQTLKRILQSKVVFKNEID